MTLQLSQTKLFDESEASTLSPEDFLAKHLALLESEEDLKTQEVHSFLKSLASLGFSNPAIYCSKTSKVFSITPGGRLSQPSSIRWGNWGIGWNGRYLTAKISEYPKTENGCSLLDILEENPEEKYFLSQDQVDKLLQNSRRV